jgi:hypothetical protein
MRVLVCGDRNWTNKEAIRAQLLHRKGYIDGIIEGGARGADSLAGECADELEIFCMVFPAEWDKYGKAAGPIRNQQMLNEGKPDLVLAFHKDIENSKGTKHMVKISRKAGIPVEVITE